MSQQAAKTASESMLRKIQALINKAEGTDNPDEAQSYFAKAEELMAQYAVSEAMLNASRPTQQRTKPVIVRGVPVCARGPLEDFISALPHRMSSYMNVRTIYSGLGKRWDPKYYRQVTMDVVGYQSDIDAFVLLYTALHLDLSGQLEPKPDLARTFDENVYIMHEAGVKWKRICDLMNAHSIMRMNEGAGILRRPGTEEWWSSVRPSKSQPDYLVPWPDGHRLISAYKRWCAEIGDTPRTVQTPVTYQRNFIEGYASKIIDRLWEAKRAAEKNATGTALVLRRDSVDDAYAEFFPDAKSGRTVRAKYDAEAVQRGRTAGANADLNGRRTGAGTSRPSLGA
jgi:hypothetical protein